MTGAFGREAPFSGDEALRCAFDAPNRICLRFCAGNRFSDHSPGVFRTRSIADLDLLSGFEILVMLEKMLDLLQRDPGQIHHIIDTVVALRDMG